jgi:hypothetical protein
MYTVGSTKKKRKMWVREIESTASYWFLAGRHGYGHLERVGTVWMTGLCTSIAPIQHQHSSC